MAFSFSASGAARWLVSVAMRRACCVARSSAAIALSSAASLACSSTSNGLRIDPVQRIAGLHFAALLEQALDDDAGDARTNVRNPGRRDPAGQFADDGAGLGSHREGADFGLGRLLLLRQRRSAHCSQPIAAPSQPTSRRCMPIACEVRTLKALPQFRVEARIEHSRRCRGLNELVVDEHRISTAAAMQYAIAAAQCHTTLSH